LETGSFRTLETAIDVPFTYTELFETAAKGIRNQNDLAQESSEVADFWNMLQGFQTAGKCVEKAHYQIRYLRSFRAISAKDDIEFKEARPVLYLNMAASIIAVQQPKSKRHCHPLVLVNHHVLSQIASVLSWLEAGSFHDTPA